MKRFDDYTEDELLELDDDALAGLIDLECALRGVPLLPEQPVQPEKPKVEPDVQYFEVAGLHFKDAEAAARVIKAIAKEEQHMVTVHWDSDLPGSTKRVETLESWRAPKVESARGFSEELKGQWSDRLRVYKNRQETYERESKEYRKAEEARANVATEILDARNAAAATVGKRARYVALYGRYLALANDNRELAAAFLLEAHPEAKEILGDELPEPKIPDGVRPPDFSLRAGEEVEA